MDTSAPADRAAAGFGPASAPRSLQFAFLLPVLALELLLATQRPRAMLSAPFLVGLSLSLLATMVLLLAPWQRWGLRAMVVVPLLDLAATGALHLTPGAEAVAALVVVPAMWLGAALGSRGVVLATAGSLVAFTVPDLASGGTTVEQVSRAFLLPTVTVVAAASMAMTSRLWTVQRVRLEQQGAELARALAQGESQRKLNEAILHTVDVGLLGIGPDGSYRTMNPRFAELQAIAFPDGHHGVAGQVGHVYDADNRAALPSESTPSMRAARGESFSDTRIWIGADPVQRLAISVSARPMVDDDGRFAGAVLAYSDITDLMRALRVKDEFVASVSHELRTPLTSIMGYLDLSTDHRDLPDEVTRYLAVAGRNADRLMLLVSDLLTVAQADGSTMRITPQPTDLGALVRAGVADVTQRARSAGLEVVALVEPMPYVVVDPGRITQVVDNLLSNAVKYTPPGGSVQVSVAPGDGVVRLVVSDTGIGIAATEQHGLFTKFFRAPNATARAIPGIGLGLVITKAIVDAHGGAIDVQSREGGGTTVEVTLPFVPTNPAAASDGDPVSSGRVRAAEPGGDAAV